MPPMHPTVDRAVRHAGARRHARSSVATLPDNAQHRPEFPHRECSSWSGEARRGNFEAVPKRNPLERGAATRDQPAKAVQLLASASPYERANPEAACLRGLAYLGLREGAKAAAEFEKILDHKGANWGSAWQHPYWGQFYSLSYLGLARAAPPSLATRRKQVRTIRSSSPSAKTPTPTSQF